MSDAYLPHKKTTPKPVKEWLMIHIGIFLVAVGIHVFKNPNQFALGGVSGLAVVLAHFFPHAPMGSFMMLANILFLVVGYFALGRESGLKTAYGAFALSGMVWLFEIILPISEPLTGQKFMELLYGVFLPGIGIAIVFNYGASTGGTEIVAKILSKATGMKISMALMLVDLSIAVLAGIAFGLEAFLFSVLGICIKSFVLDSFLESIRIYKIVVIISEKSEKVKDFICNTLERGATVHQARGAYTIKEKEVITTVLSRKQAARMQAFMRDTDPEAFITISNSSRIIGNGFGRFE